MAMTIGQIAVRHYLPEKRRRKRTHTVDGYESSIRRHVLPRWGGMRIADITRDAVQDWVDEIAPSAGPGGAEKAYKCLRQVIRWAMDKWGLYVADPTRGVEMPRKPAYRPETLTQRRLKRLIRGLVGCECEATAIIQAALGTRPGECYAVRWESVNWRTGAVPIRSTLVQGSGGGARVAHQDRQGRARLLPAALGPRPAAPDMGVQGAAPRARHRRPAQGGPPDHGQDLRRHVPGDRPRVGPGAADGRIGIPYPAKPSRPLRSIPHTARSGPRRPARRCASTCPTWASRRPYRRGASCGWARCRQATGPPQTRGLLCTRRRPRRACACARTVPLCSSRETTRWPSAPTSRRRCHTWPRSGHSVSQGTSNNWTYLRVGKLVVATIQVSIPYANAYVAQRADIALPFTMTSQTVVASISDNMNNSSTYTGLNVKAFVANNKMCVSVHEPWGALKAGFACPVSMVLLGTTA